MREIVNYFKSIFFALKTLLIGMKVTGSYFVRPWTITTQQYPENRKKLKMYERTKGELVMPHNEKNEHLCTGCGICQLNCPNGTLDVRTVMIETADGKKKKALDQYIYNLGMCTFCGLCVKVCPSDAIVFGNKFEHAVFDKNKLVKTLNKEGSTLMKGAE
ncbi:MAG: 4Fe-4S binding protein [Tenuifilaceae bacterium]